MFRNQDHIVAHKGSFMMVEISAGSGGSALDSV